MSKKTAVWTAEDAAELARLQDKKAAHELATRRTIAANWLRELATRVECDSSCRVAVTVEHIVRDIVYAPLEVIKHGMTGVVITTVDAI